MDAESAETIAVAALSFVAADSRLLDRFAALTGIDHSSLREAAASPEFLPSVLDFILAHEPTLAEFCTRTATEASSVTFARRALSPRANEEW